MTPVQFEGANRVLKAPAGMTEAECSDLYVMTDGKTCLSQWELTDEELTLLAKTRRINVWVLMGSTQPPIALGVTPE